MSQASYDGSFYTVGRNQREVANESLLMSSANGAGAMRGST